MPRSPNSPRAKALNPLRVDLAALAGCGQPRSGHWPLETFTRLLEAGEPADAVLHWQARAEYRPVPGGQRELWLHLALNTTVRRTCQRCLQPVALPLAVERDFLFAPTEAQAQARDAERDDADVLVLSKFLNLIELAEDELLLALPLVPRHDTCPQPLVAPAGGRDGRGTSGDASKLSPDGTMNDNPFAVLAQLKRRN